MVLHCILVLAPLQGLSPEEADAAPRRWITDTKSGDDLGEVNIAPGAENRQALGFPNKIDFAIVENARNTEDVEATVFPTFVSEPGEVLYSESVRKCQVSQQLETTRKWRCITGTMRVAATRILSLAAS